ncbi:bax inhibitor 1-like [Dorcoceras hygrometricum]|uniref:Bax inhibitor 1-like n=1 Tax=Dorcoceras hygrometricum TaxID=472368 RepID=A0A2Z7CN36_9LAMI|nr:bax inhibitor 1-like [Dorcoceras hygrometricum]
MNEEVTCVSQHFGVLTIGFSSCASGGRSADGLRNQSQELLIDMMARWIVLERELLPAFGRSACESCCQLVKRYGVVLISWNGVVLECFLAIAILVVPADIHERKEILHVGHIFPVIDKSSEKVLAWLYFVSFAFNASAGYLAFST